MTEQKIVVAVDFDGTCVYHSYPNIGHDVPGAVETLRLWNEAGIRIILHTMRCDRPGEPRLTEAVKWFEDRGIELFGINRNPDQIEWTDSPKVYAHAYVDDASAGAYLHYEKNSSGRPVINWKLVNAWMVVSFPTFREWVGKRRE